MIYFSNEIAFVAEFVVVAVAAAVSEAVEFAAAVAEPAAFLLVALS